MPPKRGRGRGGSRGGRGGRGGRGRGGASGSYAPFNLSKSAKRRSRKRGHSELPSDQDTPELMDLGHSSYTREIYAEAPLMKALSRRPNRSLMSEARYTDKHMEQTLSLTLRYRLVEFVKAETAYDPSKDLIEKLTKRAHHASQSCKIEEKKDAVEEEMKEEPEVEEVKGSGIVEVILPGVESHQIQEQLQDAEVKIEEVVRIEISKSSKSCSAPAEDDVDAFISEVSGQNKAKQIEHESEHLLQEHNFKDIKVNTDELPINATKEISAYTLVDNLEESNVDLDVNSQESANEFEDEEILFSIDQEGDSAAIIDYTIPKPEFKALLQESRSQRQDQDSDEGTGTIIEPYLSVGKVMLKALYDINGSTSVELPSSRSGKSAKNGFVSFKGTKRDLFKPKKIENGFQSSLDLDLEEAFDDYMAQLMLANEDDSDDSDNEIDAYSDIGSGSDYGVHDEDDDETYEKLRQQFQEFEESSDSQTVSLNLLDMMDLDIDNEDLDEEIDGAINSEEDGLEDILAFARQHKRLADLDIGTNAPPRKVGKGRKQRLELGSDLEIELRESLMEQFQYQKQSRRLKKLKKKEKRRQEAEDNLLLKDKYEYSLHIKEIKQEFELFLHDANRETLSFPPLDGHGNKTLNKLANNYNMKCIKCGGNGLDMYMKVAKTKKTFRYVPDYQLIGYIMKQRPVFRRADVKPRTREEIADTDESSRRGPKSNAYVREGDVVGALAPEIAHNNIGRKMLEMLGWSKGEGLGALGNKGISTPVLATVKKSKTGLK